MGLLTLSVLCVCVELSTIGHSMACLTVFSVPSRTGLTYMPIMPWHGAPRAKGAPVAAGIIFHISISLVTMFVRCFPKISTSSFPDLAGIRYTL